MRTDLEIYRNYRRMMLNQRGQRLTKYRQYLLLVARIQYLTYHDGKSYWAKMDAARTGYENLKYKDQSK